jgi:hypothetical protein
MARKHKKCFEPRWHYDAKTDMIVCEKCGEKCSTDSLLHLGEELRKMFERMTELSLP